MKIGQEASVGDLTALETEQIETDPAHPVPRGWDGFKFTLVCTPNSIPDTNLFSFGEDVVDGYVEVRKAVKVPPHALLEAITANNLPIDDDTFREEFVHYGRALAVEAFVDPTANESLVLLRCGVSSVRCVPVGSSLAEQTALVRTDHEPDSGLGVELVQ